MEEARNVDTEASERVRQLAGDARELLTEFEEVGALVARVGVPMAKSRQFTPSMHVLLLHRTLYGADVEAVLAILQPIWRP